MAAAVHDDRVNPDISETPQEEENKFQKAISAWRNIHLTSLVPTLDSAASDLVAHQRDSLIQRKDLAQKTKDFRKLDDTNKLSEIKSLLKSYQTYIDLVTNQSKSIHSAFLQVYTPISEAPDPYPLLEASIDSLVAAEETLPKVRDENEHLRKQVSKLTGDLEEAEAHLENERSARQALEDSRDEKIKSVEESWNAVVSEKQDNWESKEKGLEEKIEQQDRLIKEIKASYEVSQRLNQGEDAGAEGGHAGATAAELEIVHSELDRTNMRLAEVEARNEQLRIELAQSASQPERSSAVEDDPTFLRLQSENSSLMRRLENVRLDKDAERRKWDGQTKSLEREISSLKKNADAMRRKLNHWNDYENIKQELEVLKSIEFATGDDDQDLETLSGAEIKASDSNQSGKETLEQLLLSRNKKLSNELTLLRVSHQDLQSRLETLQEQLSTTNMELEKSRTLCATLETDLEKVQEEASNNFPSSAMSVAGTYTSRYPHSSYKSVRGARSTSGGRSTSPTSSIISGFDPSQSPGSLDSLRQAEGGSTNSGILPMITAQRDRFKKKNNELESEVQKSYQTIQSLRSEVASLQKDNLNLYEKTRYVSSYNRSSSSAGFPQSPNPTAIQIDPPGASEPTFHRYRSAYEANISPFNVFRNRESARALKRLILPERAIFRFARTVLATRTSRNLFAVYCMALHVLVMVMLFNAHEEAVGQPVVGKAVAGGAKAM